MRCATDQPALNAQEGSGYGAGAGEAGEAGGGGGGFDFGVDPNLDPELALALRVSLEEERARLGGQAGALRGSASCLCAISLCVFLCGRKPPAQGSVSLHGGKARGNAVQHCRVNNLQLVRRRD